MNWNEKIYTAAKKFEGRQYWSNACAFAVNDVLAFIGIDIQEEFHVENFQAVPSWQEKVGKIIPYPEKPIPGDIIFTYFQPGFIENWGKNTFGHIGIASDENHYFNVSTSHGYKFTNTAIGWRTSDRVRRITELPSESGELSDIFKMKMYYNQKKEKFTVIFDDCFYDVLSVNNNLWTLKRQ